MAEAFTILKMLLLLWAANGAPVLATRLLGNKYAQPIDNFICLPDGYPLFGTSKTWRGLLAALLAGALLAELIGVAIGWGLVIAACAMVGDLLSSFIKRRLGLLASSRALLLDQIPESLLPMLAMSLAGQISWLVAGVSIGLFIITDIWFSKLLYRLHIRQHPY